MCASKICESLHNRSQFFAVLLLKMIPGTVVDIDSTRIPTVDLIVVKEFVLRPGRDQSTFMHSERIGFLQGECPNCNNEIATNSNFVSCKLLVQKVD